MKKFYQALVVVIVVGVICLSGIYLYFSEPASFFSKLQDSVNLADGTPVNGRLWRVNDTGYIVETRGFRIEISSNIPLGNYSECYFVAIVIVGESFVQLSSVPSGITNETDCLG